MKERKDLKFKKKNEIAKLSFEDLKKEIVRSEKLLFSLKMKLSVGELKQTHLVKETRRYIARCNSFLSF